MEVFEFLMKLLIFIGFAYHLSSYKKTDDTPYHGIMSILYAMILLI